MKSNDHKTRFDLVPYFHGRILDVSEGASRSFPHFISSIEVGITEPDKCGMFADASMDGVCSSYVLHLLSESEAKAAIQEWARLIKDGGHLMLHLPSIDRAALTATMDSVDRGWDMVECRDIESGALAVFRMGDD